MATVDPQGIQWRRIDRPATTGIRPNTDIRSLVPKPRRKITIRRPDGTLVDLAELKAAGATNKAPPPIFSNNMQHSPNVVGTSRRGSSVRIETEEQRKKRREELRRAEERERLQLELTTSPTEPVTFRGSTNRWDRKVVQRMDVGVRAVNSLLNKLALGNFESISSQIILQINKSEREHDAIPLQRITKLIFKHSINGELLAPVFARRWYPEFRGKAHFGRPPLQDMPPEPVPEGFERTTTATYAIKDQMVEAINDESTGDKTSDWVALNSSESCAVQKAKRQGLGLVQFLGELFKLQMLPDRIMFVCMTRLLENIKNSEGDDIERLCKLLTTSGAVLDAPEVRAHMNVYFQRMKELAKSQNVSSRMQFMVQDVIELRERQWVSRNIVSKPTIIAQIHQAAANESYQRQIDMPPGGSRRGNDRHNLQQNGRDGWAEARSGSGPPRPLLKVGDLSNFSKISKSTPMTFGPTNIFNRKVNKQEPLSQTGLSSSLFSMLSRGPEIVMPDGEPAKDGSEKTPQRKCPVLQPRPKPIGTGTASSYEPGSGLAKIQAVSVEADTRETIRQLFATHHLDEVGAYFANPPAQHGHHSPLAAEPFSPASLLPPNPAMGNIRLNANSKAFIPRRGSKIVIKQADGTPVNPAYLKLPNPAATGGAPQSFGRTKY
ncbi:armadillo-type protein [Infundibulicybe gibba]|nr:armadillo-type protein [Infundibulicybe gibba]